MGMDSSGDDASDGGITEEQLLAIAKAWIERALSSVAEDDGGYYRKMLTSLRDVRIDDRESLSALQLRLRVLSQSVYFIDERYHQSLLDHVLGMSIWIYDGDIADALLEFVVNLATTNGGSVGRCLDMLVRNFLPPSCGLPSFLDSYSKAALISGSLTSEKIRAQKPDHMSKKEDVLGRLHAAIHQIASLVPTTTSRMQPIVYRRMPHRSSAKEWNALYLENMLRLENSAAQYAVGQMLPAVIDNLIQIDVEIRWEDILTEEESGKVYMFHMDLEEETEGREADENEAGDPAGPGIEAKIQHGLLGRLSKNQVSTLDEMADKMDLMMDMTLQHLQACAKRGQTLQVYDALVKSFQSTILHTYKSKFTQFLVFYLCSLSPDTCGSRFASLLCDIFTSKTRPPNTRMSAAAYLASYLARAKYLSIDVISTSLRRMVSWCIAYGVGESVKSTSAVSDAILHSLFFSACQAVMYILCFRIKRLADDGEGKHFLRGFGLQKFVEHRLNPLKVCLPSVVEEFLRKAIMLQLVDQKHWRITQERLDRSSQGFVAGDVRLDMFFPFDPYLLCVSDRFIRPNFIFWSMVEPINEKGVSDCEENHSDGESDISSDMESLPFEHVDSPSRGDELLFDDHERAFIKMDRNYSKRLEPSMKLDQSLGASSPCSDYSLQDSFENSFDAMAITPPQVLKMPPKLPAKLLANLSHTMPNI